MYRLSTSTSRSSARVVAACDSTMQFPERLHTMMTYVEDEGLECIVSWVDNGRALQVNNSKRLVEEVLPLFFNQTKYRSFQRQLNMWSFERILCGCNRGAFQHPYFIKGRIDLCQHQTRHTFQRSTPKSSQIQKLKKELCASLLTKKDNKIPTTTTTNNNNTTTSIVLEKTPFATPGAAKFTSKDEDGESFVWEEETPIATTSFYNLMDQTNVETLTYDKNQFQDEMSKMMRELLEPTQLLFEMFEDSNIGSSISSCWANGDTVPFEGHALRFLDTDTVE
jgi:HSF-type DNA-binding